MGHFESCCAPIVGSVFGEVSCTRGETAMAQNTEGMTPNIVDVGELETKVIRGSIGHLVLLAFCSKWCHSSNAFAGVLARACQEQEFVGSCSLICVDVEEAPVLAAGFCIQGIPTVIIFFNGKVVAKLVGSHAEKQVRSVIRSHLQSKADRLDRAARAGLHKDDLDYAKPFLREGIAMTNSPREWGDWYFEPDRLELFLDRGGCVEYSIDLEMCMTSGEILNQLVEVAGKDWTSPADVSGLLAALNDLLQLQKNLCPGGTEEHLDRIRLHEVVRQSSVGM